MAARAAACATVPGADIRQQLATLLGRETVGPIRKTDEEPPRVSVIDVATLVTGKDARKAAQDVGFVKDRYPEVAQNLGLFKFPGRAQRNTPVATCRGVVELIMLLPGRHAARVRQPDVHSVGVNVKFPAGELPGIPSKDLCS